MRIAKRNMPRIHGRVLSIYRFSASSGSEYQSQRTRAPGMKHMLVVPALRGIKSS